MRCRAIAALMLTVGACTSDAEAIDPLERERIRELALAQGSASGDAHSGTFLLEFAPDACDCPSVEYEGQTIDLCAVANTGAIDVEVGEGSGVLGLMTSWGLFTGAIQADDSFVVAGISDLGTIAGPLESLHRMDGQFSDEDAAEGWVGQRLIGELVGHTIDCRWTGSFVLARN